MEMIRGPVGTADYQKEIDRVLGTSGWATTHITWDIGETFL